MNQIHFGTYGTNQLFDTVFISPFSWVNNYQPLTEVKVKTPIPYAGTLKNFGFVCTAGPGSGKTFTGTIRQNGSSTSLLATVSGTGTSGSDTSHTVTVSAGDLIAIQTSQTGGTPGNVALTGANWSIEFAGNTTGQNFIAGLISAPSTAAQRWYCPSGGDTGGGQTTELAAQIVVPHACTLDALYVNLDTAPGASKQWTFSIYQNGSKIAGSAIVVSGGAQTTGNVTGVNVSLAQGDTISLSLEPASTPASFNGAFSVGFVSTVDGNSIVSGNTTKEGSQGNATNAIATNGVDLIGVTEGKSQSESFSTSFSMSNLHTKWDASSGGGSRTTTLRINTADSTLTINNTGSTVSSDTTHSVSFVSGDLINLRQVNSGTTSAQYLRWGMTMYIAPAGGGTSGGDWPILTWSHFWGWRYTS